MSIAQEKLMSATTDGASGGGQNDDPFRPGTPKGKKYHRFVHPLMVSDDDYHVAFDSFRYKA